MTKPVRIQRLRSKGFDLQAASYAVNGLPCVYVGRPTRWGNPFKVGVDGNAAECVRLFEDMLAPYSHADGDLEEFLLSVANIEWIEKELRGKNLACWCPVGNPCHADVLLDLVNE